MDFRRARYLVSAEARALLAGLPDSYALLPPTALARRLRRRLPPGPASAVAEQLALRGRARAKLGDAAGEWLLAPELLEMMSHPAVALRRGVRLARLARCVVDLTCGLGGDLRGAVEAGARALGIDRDPVAVLLAGANVPAAGAVRGDALRAPLLLGDKAVIIDPTRRRGGRRTRSQDDFSPPWSAALELASASLAASLMAPPGISHALIPAAAEVEFVQVGRVLRECCLWFGETARPGLRRAVLLPGEHLLDSDAPECSPEPVEPRSLILDPRPCVTRAGLVRQLAARTGSRLMDSAVAYLTCDTPVADPLADAFVVLERVPFSLARLRKRLRAGGWVPREIRRRAFPVEPDELRRLLGRMEGEPVTLLCSTLGGDRVIFITKRLS